MEQHLADMLSKVNDERNVGCLDEHKTGKCSSCGCLQSRGRLLRKRQRVKRACRVTGILPEVAVAIGLAVLFVIFVKLKESKANGFIGILVFSLCRSIGTGIAKGFVCLGNAFVRHTRLRTVYTSDTTVELPDSGDEPTYTNLSEWRT